MLSLYADDRTDLIVRLADRLSDPALKEDLLSMLAEAKSLISQDPKQYAEMMDSLERRKLQKALMDPQSQSFETLD